MEPLRIGRYELLEHVGDGSMGAVYRGLDTLLGREVAVKVMAAGFLDDEAAHVRFFREAKAVARLQHVNIVTVFEFGKHDDTPFIVMEFLRGCTLAERLRRGPQMPLGDTLDVAMQMCAGLEAAHSQGIVHRDITPGNVWVTEDGTVKLVHFGVTGSGLSDVARADATGETGYMSPEQVTGHDVDARTDIYSTGAVLYQMLAGHPPFEAGSQTAIMLKIVNQDPDPMTDPALPDGLRSATLRAMAKSPGARYGAAADLRHDLRAVKAALPVQAEPAPVSSPAIVQQGASRSESVARLVRPVIELLPEAPAVRAAVLVAAVVCVLLVLWGVVAWSLDPSRAAADPMARPRVTLAFGDTGARTRWDASR